LGSPYARTHAYFAQRAAGLPDAAAFWPHISRELYALIDAELRPFDDALETLAELRDRDIPVAVASSSPRERLDRTLARVDLAFGVSVAGDEIEHGKPAPDMFLAAAAKLGVEPGACAVIEDSAPGVAAGLAAGMRTVAIVRDGEDPARLAGAHVVLRALGADAVLGG
jgi:HAD superfamily hydrolase (TIGR01509 family)